jgi:hypothetical protein
MMLSVPPSPMTSRYDHRTRVVAYILNAVIDDDPEVSYVWYSVVFASFFLHLGMRAPLRDCRILFLFV